MQGTGQKEINHVMFACRRWESVWANVLSSVTQAVFARVRQCFDTSKQWRKKLAAAFSRVGLSTVEVLLII